jgi:hypothetical protein
MNNDFMNIFDASAKLAKANDAEWYIMLFFMWKNFCFWHK